jgi:alkanesulfonate monooxygenase SsuD/methylene tetrahydromethanopterin reductase-like flavin-dependent oxidoreductase (luciferase family)
VKALFDIGIVTDGRPAPGDRDYAKRFQELLQEARLADDLGYRSFSTSEQHYMADDGYLGSQLTALAGIAAVTSRVHLMTNTLLLPLYKWRQVVESAVVVDLLSNGRLELGVAAGENERDYHLFSVEFRRRGKLMEEGLRFIRKGLEEGFLPDGPSGELLPITPRPVRGHVPILVGGLSERAVDRAVRLGDGHISYDFQQPELNLPKFWEERLSPALSRHGKTLADFRFIVIVPVWASDDPERDWELVFRPAFEFHMGQYVRRYEFRAEQSGKHYIPPGVTTQFSRESILVDTPERLAERLKATWGSAPWHELIFFCRLPGIPHERALEQLDLVAHRLVPLLTE